MLNFGDVLDAVERGAEPDRPALLHGDRLVTWGDFSRRSNNLARAMLASGARPGDRAAIYLRNRPEYLVALSAALKARLAPVNVNYRYATDELLYLLRDADARVLVYADEFRDRVAAVRDRLPATALWVEAGDGRPPDPALPFDGLAGSGAGEPLDVRRSPDDLFYIYTGGTTGLPKGVMWPQGDLRELMVSGARARGPVPDDLEEVRAFAAAGAGPRVLPAPPLMHGTGLLTALNALLLGGSVVTLPFASFDAAEMLAAIGRHRPAQLAIVGDSFARPMLDELEAHPDRYDLSSVESITSSGVMWSLEVKRGLLRFMPGAVLNDALSSSEAVGLGVSVMTAGTEVPTARFAASPRCRVLAEDGRLLAPGEAGRGLLALGPPNPVGYHGDERKSAETFRTIDGVRYSVPGDWCEVAADGALTLLGRGSACINTAGEKVFPEEVEEVLKRHPSVGDALVVGVPDPKWGQAIVAVVAARGGGEPDAGALRDHVRASLAGYKVPKAVVRAQGPLRAANGKADYAAARAQAAALAGTDP